jgi:hypothetical protein
VIVTNTEIAWLIERSAGFDPMWWDGRGRFVSDANDAVRFARKVDAERVIDYLRFDNTVKATEHGWVEVVRDDDAVSVRPLAVDSRIVAPARGAADINSTRVR